MAASECVIEVKFGARGLQDRPPGRGLHGNPCVQLVVVVATRPSDHTTTATVRPAGASPAGIATTAPELTHAAGLIYDYNRAGFWTGSRPRALARNTHVARLT